MLIKPDNRTTLTHNTIEHGKQNQLFSSLNKRGERCEVLLTTFSILLCSLQAVAQSLPRVAPEQVGMDSHRLLHADEAIHRAIDHKRNTGSRTRCHPSWQNGLSQGLWQQTNLSQCRADGNKHCFRHGFLQ